MERVSTQPGPRRDIRVDASRIGNSAPLHDEARITNSDKAQVAKAPRDGATPLRHRWRSGFNPRIGIGGSAVVAGDDERSAAALPLRSQDGFGDRVRSSQSYNTMTTAIAIILDRCQMDLIG